MTRHPSESAGEAADDDADVEGVASARLTPDDEWTEERMRAAKPRGISLDPDGKRRRDAESKEP